LTHAGGEKVLPRRCRGGILAGIGRAVAGRDAMSGMLKNPHFCRLLNNVQMRGGARSDGMTLPRRGLSPLAAGARARPGCRLFKSGALAVGLGLAAAAMPGCAKAVAVQAKPLPSEAVAQIVDGKTSEAEIREWFGPTSDVVVTSTGKVLTYQFKKETGGILSSLPLLGSGGSGSSGQLLIVTLDDKGTVVRHAYFGSP